MSAFNVNNFDPTNFESLQAAKAAFDAKAAQDAMSPASEVPAEQDQDSQQAPATDGPSALTEEEVIEAVKQRIAENWTTEEIIEEVIQADQSRQARYGVPASGISISRLEEIVRVHAGNAPHKQEIVPPKKDEPNPSARTYPPELRSLIESGRVWYDEDGEHWVTKRCETCGEFPTTACHGEENFREVSVVSHDGERLFSYGRQIVGLEPIVKPKSVEEHLAESRVKADWWKAFRSVDELEHSGGIKMYIEGFLPEGITIISGNPKEGKSQLVMAIAKALTEGTPLFGNPRYAVPERVPVLYLYAEGKDSAFEARCRKFGITNDKTRFACRTLSQGLMVALDDPNLIEFVKTMRPVIVLDTLRRFNQGEDEDDSTDSANFADALFRLMGLGARAVIGIHHPRKDLNKQNPTQAQALRGSGDLAAIVEVVWLVMRDDRLYHKTGGVNEIDVVSMGSREFGAEPVRVALTGKAPEGLPEDKMFMPGIVSYIDTTGNLKWLNRASKAGDPVDTVPDQELERLIQEDPTISLRDIAEQTNSNYRVIGRRLGKLGWIKGRGRSKDARWTQAELADG